MHFFFPDEAPYFATGDSLERGRYKATVILVENVANSTHADDKKSLLSIISGCSGNWKGFNQFFSKLQTAMPITKFRQFSRLLGNFKVFYPLIFDRLCFKSNIQPELHRV